MRFTLVSDGSSDRALIPIIVWTLRAAGVTVDLQPRWADFRHLLNPPTGLVDRIAKAVDLYPCEMLFVHRDAEREALQVRKQEIETAIQRVKQQGIEVPHICVIPIRMQEAWLLFREQAIREAAGNPHGRVQLDLPAIGELEEIPDPKALLFDLLRKASELNGRRLRKLSLSLARARISELIDDFSALRQLEAFRAFEVEMAEFLAATH